MLDAAPDSRLSIKLATRVVIDDRIISMHIKMPISPVCVDCVVSRRSQGVLHKDGRKVHAADGRLDCLGLGEGKGGWRKGDFPAGRIFQYQLEKARLDGSLDI